VLSVPIISISIISMQIGHLRALRSALEAVKRCSSLSELPRGRKLVLELCPMPSSISYINALVSSFCPLRLLLFSFTSAFCDSFPILTRFFPNMPFSCVNSLSRSSSDSNIS
jgi:hypothetical protein